MQHQGGFSGDVFILQIMIPHDVEYSWSLYVFGKQRKQVTVLDPVLTCYSAARYKTKHGAILELLIEGMSRFGKIAQGGWV